MKKVKIHLSLRYLNLGAILFPRGSLSLINSKKEEKQPVHWPLTESSDTNLPKLHVSYQVMEQVSRCNAAIKPRVCPTSAAFNRHSCKLELATARNAAGPGPT